MQAWSEIENRSPFSIEHVLDPKPECQEEIQCKTKSKGYESQVDKGGSDHSGSDTQSLCDPTAYLKAPLLKIVQDLVKVLHGLKILHSA